MVLQIRRPRPGLAELDVAGRVQRLDVSAHSVAHASGGYLLRDPIEVDAAFTGAFGTVRVAQTNVDFTSPAGSFTRCVVTVEESKFPPKRATSTYCPGVGLVSLVVEGDTGDGLGRVESLLKSYGPRVVLAH